MPLCDDPHSTDGIRASGRQHPIKRRDTNGRLGLLSVETSSSQSGSNQRLVTAHCRFDQRALAMVCCPLPGQSSLFRDHREVPVTLRELIRFSTQYRGRAWWDYDFNVIAVSGDRGVGWAAFLLIPSLFGVARDNPLAF